MAVGQKTWQGWWASVRENAALFLCLLPLGWIFDLAGYIPWHVRTAWLAGLLILPTFLWPSVRTAVGALGVLVVVTVRALVFVPPIADLALWLGAYFWVWCRVEKLPRTHVLFRGVLAFTPLYLFLFLSPIGYSVLETLTQGLNTVTCWITGQTFHVGPTYQGTGIFLLFLCLSIAQWSRDPASLLRTICWAGAALLLQAFLLLLLLRKVDFGADYTWQLKFREPFGIVELWKHLRGLPLLIYPGFAFVAHEVVYGILHSSRLAFGFRSEGTASATPTRTFWQQWGPIGVSVGLAVVVTALCCPPTAWRHPKPREILFIERGVVSFSKPDYTRFGRAAGGMFGFLPEYARLFGCQGRVVKQVPKKLDPSSQIIMFTNLDEPLDPETWQQIWEFIAAGGRLLVLGDHTFIKNGRNHINDLLAPCHIRLHHDSAQFFPQGWFHSYRMKQGTPFALLQDPAENRIGLLVGASLEVRAPAVPFLMGRFGYGDLGALTPDPERGYLGDFKYQPEERLGDLVLVAGELYGKGRVLVMGDTSAFFNHALPHAYELLRSVLSWLCEEDTLWEWPYRKIGRGLVLGLTLLLAIWILTRSRSRFFVTVAGPILAVWIFGSSWAHRDTGLLPWNAEFSRQRVALIDFSHEPEASKHSSMGTGLHGLTINLMRYGMLPIELADWRPEFLQRSRLLILNAPRRALTGSEVRQIEQFLKRGGTVWLTCGYFHAWASRRLLDAFGLSVEGIPLGRFFDRPAFGQPVSFFSAWPMRVRNREASLICVYGDWPLMVYIPVGKGHLVVIADSEFFQNRNIETMETYDPNNIRFIRNLLSYTVGTLPP